MTFPPLTSPSGFPWVLPGRAGPGLFSERAALRGLLRKGVLCSAVSAPCPRSRRGHTSLRDGPSPVTHEDVAQRGTVTCLRPHDEQLCPHVAAFEVPGAPSCRSPQSAQRKYFFFLQTREWARFVSLSTAVRTGCYEVFWGRAFPGDVVTVGSPSWWPYIAGS